MTACSHHGGDDDDGNGAALTITPPTAMVTLAPSGSGYSATQAFKVTAKDSSGNTKDVTSQISWDGGDDVNISFDQSGNATVLAAGPYTITAQLSDQMATATLTASLATTGLGDGFNDGDQGKLDGPPSAAAAPSIAYPLAGSLFPVNMTPIEIHAKKSDPSQTLARIALADGTLLDYKFYAACKPSPNAATFPDACIVTIPDAIANQLAGVSEAADVQLTVRLAAADGSMLAESAPTALAWSKVALTGGLYYWTTAGKGDTTFNTAIARYDFSKASQPPEIYLSSDSAPKVPTDTQCVGCHAVSPDGAKLSFSLGGSQPGYFSVFDVATTQPIVPGSGLTAKKFAGMSTFSPDGSRMVTMEYGDLTLRTGDGTLTMIKDHLFTDSITGEQMSHPFWSPTGGHFAFVSWTPSAADIQADHITGDMVQGGQIWLADSDGQQMTSAPRMLVPRAANITSYYPAISDDDQYVVFNQSRCDGPANSNPNTAWGGGPCDGYNDISATLHVVPTTGGTPIALTNANGGDDPLTTNSWPRWSPDHGTFRGKQLYWVAFSSRRTYGLSLAGSPASAPTDTTKPQLWFAAVALDGTTPTVDPSFAPVWLPGQNSDLTGPRGNHTPVWTSKVVIIE
ncbi:MAG TPA: hypothetical protein VH165_23560 [Kofleriaceae bacterium]|nr:hypothetical protein [Kofleriaceae bacterium]